MDGGRRHGTALVLRYNNAMRREGGVDAWQLPATGEPRLLGRLRQAFSSRWDEFRWSSLRLGPVPSKPFRIRLACLADMAD